MIKVVASDLDGTLLNEEHKVSECTAEMVKRIQENGVEFIVATGRNALEAKDVIQDSGILCDCLLASGAEVRDRAWNVLRRIPMDYDDVERVEELAGNYPVALYFFSNEQDYMVGTPEEVEDLLVEEFRIFFMNGTDEEIRNSEFYQSRRKLVTNLSDVREFRRNNIPVFKIFLFSSDSEAITALKKIYTEMPGVASAASADSNIELTDIHAQKGPVLKEYIEARGYDMEEVMVLGDSENDYSMLSMEFGATVAMENASEKLKKVARYITRSNREDGVAYILGKMLKNELSELENPNH